ncbi:MAG: PKD domain-containing protein, partial [bacterium]
WDVTVDGTGAVQMVPVRSNQAGIPLGSTFMVDINNYMGGALCSDCVRPGAVRRPNPANPNLIEVTFEARHPIPLPAQGGSPAPKDRLDLHVHDVQALVVSEGNQLFNAKTKLIRGDSVLSNPVRLNPSFLVNPDGFSSHLDPDIDNFYPTNANVHPYKIFFQNGANGNYSPAVDPINGYPDLWNPTGHNVMPMGAGYQGTPFQFFIPNNTARSFMMVVSCSYGISAQGRGTDIGKRMNPRYFLPLFNMKEAWKVTTLVHDNNLAGSSAISTTKVDVNIYDWQQLATVDPVFSGASSNLNKVDRASKLRSCEIDVPALGFNKLLSSSDFTGSGQEGDPLKTTVTINNAALAAGGNYWGLVAARDDYEGVDTNTRGIEKDLTSIFPLRDFSTYQVFLLPVLPSNNPPNAVISTTPSPAEAAIGANIRFDGSASTDDIAITSYLWDFHYSGNPADFHTEATGAVVNYAYVSSGNQVAALVVTDNNVPAQQDIATVKSHLHRSLALLRGKLR